MATQFPTPDENNVVGIGGWPDPTGDGLEWIIPELRNTPGFARKFPGQPVADNTPDLAIPGSKNINKKPEVVNFTNVEGTPYSMAIVIVNTHDRAYYIRPASFKQLVLTDNASSPFHNGYIILDNSFDIIERQIDAVNEQRAPNTPAKKGFLFKGDARDLILIDIFPTFTINEASSPIDAKDKNVNKYFRITLHGSIYNTEEILLDTPGTKYKKLYFRDLYEQILLEKNSYYSTANFGNNSNTINASNAQRSLPTHEAIKTFLTSFFSNDDGYPVTITDKSEDFDKGASRIFFSSPANFKGIDTLNYLLDRHVSDSNNNYDFALLELDRSSRVFTLESMTSIFKKALLSEPDPLVPDKEANAGLPGPYFLETYLLGGYTDFFSDKMVSSSTQFIRYAPYKDTVYMYTAGTINNFTIDMMPGEFTQQLVNSSIVHSYNFNNHEFSMDVIDNSYEVSNNVYYSNYVKTLNSQYSTNFAAGTYKFLSKNLRNEYSTKTDDEDTPIQSKAQRLSYGRNKFLKSAVFLNQAISFKVPGSTHRQANRFIGINRNSTLDISEFDQRMLGTYYVTEVKHVFEGGEYNNEIKAVKTYNYFDIYQKQIKGI